MKTTPVTALAALLIGLAATSALAVNNAVLTLPQAPVVLETSPAAHSAPFFIKGHASKCIDAGSPETRHAGRPLVLSACNATLAQRLDIVEVDAQRHEVVLTASDYCIGPRGGLRTVGAPLELQICQTLSLEQRFAIDGDSIINLAPPPSNSLLRERVVIEPERGRTADGTAIVFGQRDLDDSEFWTFTPVPVPGKVQFAAPTLPGLRARADLTAPRTHRQKPTLGFVTVGTESELRSALLSSDGSAPAKPGTVIELAAHIDLTPNDGAAMLVPEGVTIRGGRRAMQLGFQIAFPSDFSVRHPLFIVQGDSVRITGLRIRGPSAGKSSSQPKVHGIKVLVDRGNPTFNTIIDHNELSNFTHAAVRIEGGPDIGGESCRPPQHYHMLAPNVRVVRNFIHHNRRQGEGYGVEVAAGGHALVQGNTFDNNRHAIAATFDGRNEYYAHYNLVTPAAPLQESKGLTWYSHDFDVHGSQAGVGFDFEDGWVPPHAGGTAGKYFDIAHNTFLGTNRENLDLRGTPCLGARFYDNVLRLSRDDSITDRSYGNVLTLWGNRFSQPDPRKTLGSGDFDGDGNTDHFLATGAAWYYRPAGQLEWRFLRGSSATLEKIELRDVDGDGRTDAVYRDANRVYASWAAISPGEVIQEDPLPPQGDPGEPPTPPGGQRP